MALTSRVPFKSGLARVSLLAAAIAGGAIYFPAPVVLPVAGAADPIPAEQQAAALLNTARRSYNDRNYPLAISQFRDYTQRFGNQKDILAAWYGLGLAQLDGPRDYPAAVESFRQAVAVPTAPDRPIATYFIGVSLRGLGNASLKLAAEKPPEAPQHRAAAQGRYDEAANHFAQSATLLGEQLKASPDEQKSGLVKWVARARCDQADALVRAGKHKDAAAVAEIVANDAMFAETGYKPTALYQVGQARFGLKEYLPAGKALSQLAPFDQPFGLHARYLLGRVHHLSDERALAGVQYKAVASEFEATRKIAQQQLQQGGNALPAEKRAFLEQLATGPTPDYVHRSAFYSALLLSEEGKFPEARDLFVKFADGAKTHPLAAEAKLRSGFCQLQARQYAEAIATLTPLKDDAKLGDQATWWLARAALQSADPAKPEAVETAAKNAAELLKVAAAKALAAVATDPQAKVRRADILLDLADAQVQAKLPREAVATLQAVLNENASPDRVELAAQRNVTALHYAGEYAASDAGAAVFEQRFPKSTLLPSVWFRSAENAYLAAVAADKPETTAADRERLFSVAVLRYQKLIDKAPEFTQLNLARQGMAMSFYRIGKYDQTIAALTKIPDADRNGELAELNYFHADTLIRTFPPETDDALTAAGLIQAAEQAAKLMEGFVGSNPKSPLVPEAILKHGYCYQRMADLLAEKPERDKALQVAREAFDRHLKQFADHPTAAAVVLERAKVIALQGDVGGAMNELRRFQADPLRQAPNSALAAIRLGSLYRSQGQAKEAIDLLAKVRAEQEAVLLQDKARSSWAPMLAYEHALAVKESGKPADARKMFEELAAKYAGKPEQVNAAWRAVQCRREELAKQLADARLKLNAPGVKKEEAEAAGKALEVVATGLTDAAKPLAELAEKLVAEKASPAVVQQVLYELAWCDRTSGQVESEIARQKAQRDMLEKVLAKLPKKDGQTPPALMAPTIDLSAIPPMPAEVRAKERYQKLIAAGSDSPLAARSRFELAEMIVDRGEHDAALDLLNAAMLTGPDEDLTRRIRPADGGVFPRQGRRQDRRRRGEADPRTGGQTQPAGGDARAGR